jgi:hypothetical protein
VPKEFSAAPARPITPEKLIGIGSIEGKTELVLRFHSQSILTITTLYLCFYSKYEVLRFSVFHRSTSRITVFVVVDLIINGKFPKGMSSNPSDRNEADDGIYYDSDNPEAICNYLCDENNISIDINIFDIFDDEDSTFDAEMYEENRDVENPLRKDDIPRGSPRHRDSIKRSRTDSYPSPWSANSEDEVENVDQNGCRYQNGSTGFETNPNKTLISSQQRKKMKTSQGNGQQYSHPPSFLDNGSQRENAESTPKIKRIFLRCPGCYQNPLLIGDLMDYHERVDCNFEELSKAKTAKEKLDIRKRTAEGFDFYLPKGDKRDVTNPDDWYKVDLDIDDVKRREVFETMQYQVSERKRLLIEINAFIDKVCSNTVQISRSQETIILEAIRKSAEVQQKDPRNFVLEYTFRQKREFHVHMKIAEIWDHFIDEGREEIMIKKTSKHLCNLNNILDLPLPKKNIWLRYFSRILQKDKHFNEKIKQKYEPKKAKKSIDIKKHSKIMKTMESLKEQLKKKEGDREEALKNLIRAQREVSEAEKKKKKIESTLKCVEEAINELHKEMVRMKCEIDDGLSRLKAQPCSSGSKNNLTAPSLPSGLKSNLKPPPPSSGPTTAPTTAPRPNTAPAIATTLALKSCAIGPKVTSGAQEAQDPLSVNSPDRQGMTEEMRCMESQENNQKTLIQEGLRAVVSCDEDDEG